MRIQKIIIGLFLISSCSHLENFFYSRPFEPVSFQALRRVEENIFLPNYSDQGALLWAYSKIGPVIYSECQNAPSDSKFLSYASSQGCAVPVALAMSIARLIREHDLANVSPHQPLVYKDHLVWPDFALGCSR